MSLHVVSTLKQHFVVVLDNHRSTADCFHSSKGCPPCGRMRNTAKEQLQTKAQPPHGWWEKPCVHGAALGGSSGLRYTRALRRHPAGSPPLPFLCGPDTSLGSAAQELETPGTRSSPKGAEGEELGTSGGETRSEKYSAGNTDHGTTTAPPAHTQAVGPTWLTPPESLVHIASFLASPTVVPWKSMPLWD